MNVPGDLISLCYVVNPCEGARRSDLSILRVTPCEGATGDLISIFYVVTPCEGGAVLISLCYVVPPCEGARRSGLSMLCSTSW